MWRGKAIGNFSVRRSRAGGVSTTPIVSRRLDKPTTIARTAETERTKIRPNRWDTIATTFDRERMTMRLPARAACLFCFILALPASAANQGPLRAKLEGRWQFANAEPIDADDPPLSEPIEIVACPEGFCGRIIDANGRCGPVVLRVASGAGEQLRGKLTAGRGVVQVSLGFREERLYILYSPWLRRTAPPRVVFVRQGPPACAPAVS